VPPPPRLGAGRSHGAAVLSPLEKDRQLRDLREGGPEDERLPAGMHGSGGDAAF